MSSSGRVARGRTMLRRAVTSMTWMTWMTRCTVRPTPGPIARMALLACTVAALAGCAQIRYVDIDSKPSGATIYVDGEKKGVTREARLKLDFRKDPEHRVLIQLVKPRYRPAFMYWSIDEVPEGAKVVSLEAE